MTSDIKRLRLMERWIFSKIREARINSNTISFNKWVERHKKVIKVIDKIVLSELKNRKK